MNEEWADFLREIEHRRTASYEVAVDLEDEGKPAERAFGKVDAYDEVLRLISCLGAPSGDEPDCSAVTRFEVIDHTIDSRRPVSYSPDVARSVVARNVKVDLGFQDDGQTLKVFLTSPETSTPRAGEKE